MGRQGTIRVTGELLERLANAVNGWHREGPLWFVVAEMEGDYTFLGDPDDPNEVAFLNQGDAHVVLAKQVDLTPEGTLLDVLGPYESTLPPAGFGLTVKEVSLELHGKPLPNHRLMDGADMMVWTPAAFNKFVAPYYFKLGNATGKAFADIQRLRRECFGPGKMGLMVHYWPTRSVGFDEEGAENWSIVKPA